MVAALEKSGLVGGMNETIMTGRQTRVLESHPTTFTWCLQMSMQSAARPVNAMRPVLVVGPENGGGLSASTVREDGAIGTEPNLMKQAVED